MTAGSYPWDGHGLSPASSPKARETSVLEMKHVDRCEEGISTPSSPRLESVVEEETGTELLGYLATGPAVFLLLLKLLGSYSLLLGSANEIQLQILVILWYYFVLGVESALKFSPTLQRILDANTSETTQQALSRVKETETVRVEVVMRCYREKSRGNGVLELVWEGKSAFPVGSVTDVTSASNGIETLPAVTIEYESQLEFADERSKIDFEKHMNAFEENNKEQGDAYELAYSVRLPNVRDGSESITFADLSRQRPLRASLLGFYIFAALGMTVPYRIITKRLVPNVKVSVVKRISSVWPGRAMDCDFDTYPSVDYGA